MTYRPKTVLVRARINVLPEATLAQCGPMRSGWVPIFKFDDSKFSYVGRVDFLDDRKSLSAGESANVLIRIGMVGDLQKYIIPGGVGRIVDRKDVIAYCTIEEIVGTIPDLEMGDSTLSDNEQFVLEKSLTGPLPAFDVLRNQIKNLRAISRSRYFHVQYEYIGEPDGLVTDEYSNFVIDDTKFTIEESPAVFHVETMVVRGHITYFHIKGKYDMSKNFTVKDVFWRVDSMSAQPDRERLPDVAMGYDNHYVVDPNQRDIENAIGFIPTYR